MTEKKKKARKEEEALSLVVDAEVRGEREEARRLGKFWSALEYLVGFVPSYRESRKGRAGAKQARVVLVALGILVMAFGGAESALWILVGVVLASSAFMIPVPELKKRSWRAKLQKKQHPQKREIWEAGSVIYDGRRVELHQGGKKVRHVQVNREKHTVEVGSLEGYVCMAIQPPGKRKKETIFLMSREGEKGEEPEFTRTKVDRVARVSAGDFDRVREALGGEVES